MLMKLSVKLFTEERIGERGVEEEEVFPSQPQERKTLERENCETLNQLKYYLIYIWFVGCSLCV